MSVSCFFALWRPVFYVWALGVAVDLRVIKHIAKLCTISKYLINQFVRINGEMYQFVCEPGL